MNQENAYSKGCKVKYLLKSKTSVDLVNQSSIDLVGSIVKSLKGFYLLIPKALDAATL